MNFKLVILMVLLILVSISGCTNSSKDQGDDPTLFVLTPIDFPPEYELDKEEVMANQSDSTKGFYISMKFKRYDDRSVIMTWTNIGYVFDEPDVQKENLADLMALVYPNSIEIDPPVVGDKNFFYTRVDPNQPDMTLYIFIYEKDSAQGFTSVSARGISENEIRRILNTLKMKIA